MDSSSESRYPARRTTQSRATNRAPVAQLDRVLPSEGRGHTFESCRARHKIKDLGHFSGGLFLWYGIHTENRIPYARPFHPIYLPPSPLSVRSACSHFARQNGALLCLWRCAWVLVAARAKRAPKGCKASGCYNISVRLFTLPCHGKPIFEAHPSPTEVC